MRLCRIRDVCLGASATTRKDTMASNINPNPFTTRPEIDGTFGVVASTHWIATAVGMAHAGEAAATPSTPRSRPRSRLQVVEPHLNGPGGDVPVIVHDVRKGNTSR